VARVRPPFDAAVTALRERWQRGVRS
jgi:hypothetical protein